MRGLNWLDEIDYSEHLSDEYNAIIKLIGIEAFSLLFERFRKTYLYFPEKPFVKLKKIYVLQHPEMSAKDLAFKLDVSERYVEKLRDSGGRDPDTPDMFEVNN